MDMTALAGYGLHVATAYMMAYLLYLVVRMGRRDEDYPFGKRTYDSGHLVLRRRYI
jgi:hypothetical protein